MTRELRADDTTTVRLSKSIPLRRDYFMWCIQISITSIFRYECWPQQQPLYVVYICMSFLFQRIVRPCAICIMTDFDQNLNYCFSCLQKSVALFSVLFTILMDTPKHPNHGYFLIYIAAHNFYLGQDQSTDLLQYFKKINELLQAAIK